MISRVYVASDHNGNAARAYVMKFMSRHPWDVRDLGPTEAEGKVDYPDKAAQVCQAVQQYRDSAGILICGTGTGMMIAANKHKGIRAGIATDRATAELMREHNDCNVLVLGQWRNSLSQMEEMVVAFLTTKFGEGRHIPRIKKLEALDA